MGQICFFGDFLKNGSNDLVPSRSEGQVKTIFCSRDIGSNGGQNGSKMGFSEFSQKLANRFGSIS